MGKSIMQFVVIQIMQSAECLVEVKHPFTDTSQLTVAHNVYLAVYAAAHALHSLLFYPGQDSPPGNPNCTSPHHIQPIDVNILL